MSLLSEADASLVGTAGGLTIVLWTAKVTTNARIKETANWLDLVTSSALCVTKTRIDDSLSEHPFYTTFSRVFEMNVRRKLITL